jgi:hypothetical protein
MFIPRALSGGTSDVILSCGVLFLAHHLNLNQGINSLSCWCFELSRLFNKDLKAEK